MPNKLIPPTKGLGYADFYLDFLAGRESARSFFVSASVDKAAAQLDRVAYKRREMADILERQNRKFGSSPVTMANIERLNQPDALCVFAGQQAGIFGGPMMTLVKALGIVKLARLYSERLKRPVVPIFWVASDDHDFAEVNHTWLLNRESELCRIAYETAPPIATPMSETGFEDLQALSQSKAMLQNCLGQSDFTAQLYDLIDLCYTPGETFASAFGRLFAAMTRDTGLIIFDPGDPAVKSLSVPFFKATLSRQPQLHDVVNRANERLTAAGYHLQVQKHEQATHLFVNLDGRKPVLRNGEYSVGDQTFTEADLQKMIENEPVKFSPDVLLRPVLQSYLLPVLGQTGGPSELAYFAQMNGLFALFDLPAPYYAQRPTVTLVEKRYEKIIAEHEICFSDFTGDVEQVVNRVLAKTFPHDIEKSFEQLRVNVTSRFDTFTKDSLKFDPSLEEFAKQTAGKIDFTLKAFEGKIFSSHKKKSKETRDRLYRLEHTLFPNHGLQERTINFGYFLARYGDGVVSFLLDQIDAEQTAHQVISLSEYAT